MTLSRFPLTKFFKFKVSLDKKFFKRLFLTLSYLYKVVSGKFRFRKRGRPQPTRANYTRSAKEIVSGRKNERCFGQFSSGLMVLVR